MIGLSRGLGRFILGAGALAACTGVALAQTAPDQPPSNSVCARLEAQLATVDRGTPDPARADLISHAEEAIAKQQADLDRLAAQSHRLGCEGIAGFFSLFTGQSQQCQPLNAQIQQIRGNLDRMMSDLERLKSGNTDREGQRRVVIGQLAQNNCGAQYSRAAAQTPGPGGFLETLLGGIVNPSGGEGGPAGTYRTVCVRTCDGFFFPVSYSTVPDHFADDQRTCQRMCPASEAMVYSYRNSGEDITQAVSIGGRTYTELPNAFRYRREFTSNCSCRRPGQSWADALKNSCSDTYALTPPGRLQAMTNRISATLEAVRMVRPALEAFYNALSDEQRARFNALSPRLPAPSEDQPQQEAKAESCGASKSSLTGLPIERIDAVLRPTAAQKGALDRLSAATKKAVEGLQAACPDEVPVTPVGRLQAMEMRLSAMLQAANEMRPALDDFYASLTAEQKARFNTLQQVAGQ